jgi:hypothetical protein
MEVCLLMTLIETNQKLLLDLQENTVSKLTLFFVILSVSFLLTSNSINSYILEVIVLRRLGTLLFCHFQFLF